MKIRYPYLIILCLLIGTGAIIAMLTRSSTASSTTLPKPASYPFEEATKMAAEKLPIWLKSMQNTNSCANYGFKDCAETQRATLGKPYISYAFNARLLAESATPAGNFRNQLDGGINIEFPILASGEVRSNMSVVYRDGSWSVGRYGGSPRHIVQLQQHLAAQGISERVDQVMFKEAVFGLLDYKGQSFLIPLDDHQKLFPELDFTSYRMYPPEEVLPLVHVLSQQMKTEYEQSLREQQEREQQRSLTPSVIPPTIEQKPTPNELPSNPYPVPYVPTQTAP